MTHPIQEALQALGDALEDPIDPDSARVYRDQLSGALAAHFDRLGSRPLLALTTVLTILDGLEPDDRRAVLGFLAGIGVSSGV